MTKHDASRISDSGRTAITGVTGAVGGAVARLLAEEHAQSLRLLVRDVSKLPRLGEISGETEIGVVEYGAPDAVEALRGVRVLFMVSAAESVDRVAQHCAFVDAAAAAGVEHIVYTSFLGAAPDATFTLGRDHFATEEHIRASGMTWTFLRDNFYADVFELFAGPDRILRGPAGDGRVSPVARADVARCAAAVLEDPEQHRNATYDLTGPHALTLDEIAQTLTQVRALPYRYLAETLDEAYASRSSYGEPDWQVEAWVSTYTAIAAGEVERLSDDVERITGTSATTYEELVVSTPPAQWDRPTAS